MVCNWSQGISQESPLRTESFQKTLVLQEIYKKILSIFLLFNILSKLSKEKYKSRSSSFQWIQSIFNSIYFLCIFWPEDQIGLLLGQHTDWRAHVLPVRPRYSVANGIGLLCTKSFGYPLWARYRVSEGENKSRILYLLNHPHSWDKEKKGRKKIHLQMTNDQLCLLAK